MSLKDRISPALEEEIAPSLIGDPFRLGVRWLRRTLPDGTEESYQIPLTLDDLLFPEEGDHPVQLAEHTEDCIYLGTVLKLRKEAIPGSWLIVDHRVDFDVPDLRPLGHDVAFFFNVRDPSLTGGTLRVDEVDADPALVVEITSPDTRQHDLRTKKAYYHQAKVACYVIIDSRVRGGVRQKAWLVGYRYTADGFEPIPIDDQGRLWVEPLNIWLKIVERQVRCIDGATGELIEPFMEQYKGRVAAEARAEAAEARTRAELAARVDLEAQMAAMQAELRRLRGEI